MCSDKKVAKENSEEHKLRTVRQLFYGIHRVLALPLWYEKSGVNDLLETHVIHASTRVLLPRVPRGESCC